MTPQNGAIGRDDQIVLRLKTPTSTKIDDLATVRGPLATFLKANHLSSRRAIRAVPPAQLLEWEAEAKKGEFAPRRSLTAYWLLDGRRATRPIKQLVTELRRIAGVAEAYQQPRYRPAVTLPVNDPAYLAGSQNYLKPAPMGIDAEWAWLRNPSRDGAGARFVDVELGWQYPHEDIDPLPPLSGGVNRLQTSGAYHGLGVLGIVHARTSNGVGIAGIAPGANALLIASARYPYPTAPTDPLQDTVNVADALVTVRAGASAGAVVLVEVQTASGGPVEATSMDKDAITLTVAGELVVVEAAGDGAAQLTTYPGVTTADSGAIIVAGGRAAVAAAGASHGWDTVSNWGARVDAYAWGEHVYTTGGYGNSPTPGVPQNAQARYTDNFSASSSAAAIVAGAALVVQGAYAGSTLGARTPTQLRNLFRTTGTAGDAANPIGRMPDLRQLIPDIFIRDNLADAGSVPAADPLSVSPDIIVTLTQPADPQATYGAGSANENVDTLGEQVQFGQTNYVYVRMKNLGTGIAAGCRATVYYSEPSSLVTPSNWHLIGQSGPVDVDSNLTVAPAIPWNTVPATGHYCFIALVDHPLDPKPPLPTGGGWTGFVNFIRDNNNVTWRNFNVVDIPPGTPTPMPFWIKGADDSQRTFDFEIVQDPPGLALIDFEVPLALSGKFPAQALPKPKIDGDRKVAIYRLPAKQRVALPKVALPARARLACRFVVEPQAATKAKAVPTVALRQLFKDKEVGRITWGWRSVKRGAQRR